MTTINQQILLASRPDGEADASTTSGSSRRRCPTLQRRPGAGAPPLPEPRPLHARAHERRQELRRSRSRSDEVMIGGTVGEVVESRHPSYAAGDKVVGMGGWQQYARRRRRPAGRAAQGRHDAHSAVGLPGRGRHARRHRLVRPDADQRAEGRRDDRRSAPPAARSAASVGQLAKARGCRAVGIAGGAEKCAYVTDELGFDACIDYKAHRRSEVAVRGAEGGRARRHRRLLRERRRRDPRRGAAAHERLRPHRAVRNDRRLRRPADPAAAPAADPAVAPEVEGFIVSEHMEVWPEALKELGTLVADRQAQVPRDRSPRAWQRRPRPSSACSRAATSASSWSSWSEAGPMRGSAPVAGRGIPRRPAAARERAPARATPRRGAS